MQRFHRVLVLFVAGIVLGITALSIALFVFFGRLGFDGFSALGFDSKKSYLMVLMNNSEMRPSGGFISAFATVDMFLGIPSIALYDSYDIPSPDFFIEPPYPLNELLKDDIFYKGFVFRDSNFDPDFSKSAQEMLHVYEQSTGKDDFDAVFAITISGMESLLSLIEPVMVSGKTVRIRDLFHVLQVESKNIDLHSLEDLENRKGSMNDVFRQFVSFVSFRPWTWMSVYASLKELIATKQFVAYSPHQSWQSFFDDQSVSGRLLSTTPDYVHVNIANIGGRKADRFLIKSMRYFLHARNGRLSASLSVRLTHAGGKGLYSDFYQGFLRLYLPSSVGVIQHEGQFFSPVYSQEGVNNDHRVFGGLVHLWPGETKEYTFQYDLPYVSPYRYDLTIFPQIGNFGEQWEIVARSHELDSHWKASETLQVRESLAHGVYTLFSNTTFSLSLLADTTPVLILSQRFISSDRARLVFSEPIDRTQNISIECNGKSQEYSFVQEGEDMLDIVFKEFFSFEEKIPCILRGVTDVSGNSTIPSEKHFTLVYRPV